MDSTFERLEKNIADLEQQPDRANDLADTLAELAGKIYLTDTVRARVLAQRAYDLSIGRGYKTGQGYASLNLGIIEYLASNYKQAIVRAFEAREIFDAEGDIKGRAKFFNLVGLIYKDLGNVAKAMESLMQGLKLLEHLGDKENLAGAYNNLARLYEGHGDPDRALEQYQRSIEIDRERGDVHGEGVTLLNIGRLKKGREALECFARSQEILEQHQDWMNLSSCLGSQAGMLSAQGEHQQALEVMQRGLQAALKAGNRSLEAASQEQTGRILMAQGKPQEALAPLKRGLALAEEIHSRGAVAESHQALAEAFERIGDFKSAIGHLKLFHEANRSIMREENEVKIKALSIQYELEKKQEEAEFFRGRSQDLSELNQALQRANEMLTAQSQTLTRMATEDGLTGLYNRRYIENRLEGEFARAKRYDLALTVAMVDIDHFKFVNDTFSHLVGDAVLMELAGIFRANLRSIDLLARYGGEEFLIVFPETPLSQGWIVCERIRSMTEGYNWDAVAKGLKVTVSIGMTGEISIPTYEKMLALADAKLYQAKKGGRNLVAG